MALRCMLLRQAPGVTYVGMYVGVIVELWVNDLSLDSPPMGY